MTKSPSNLSQLKDFLSYLATVKGDLSNITAPPLAQVYTAPDSEQDLGNGESGDVKKPLNAFLGELFLGTFAGSDGSMTRLICEQVSHPPVTACCLYNKVHGISSSSYIAQETTFNPVAGVRNSVHAEISNIRDGGRILFEISGQWNGKLTITDTTNDNEFEGFYVDDVPLMELRTKQVDEQNPWESRRAWCRVVEGIAAGDMHAVRNEKNMIENAQRDMRAAEEQVDLEWPRLFFMNDDNSQEFALLAKAISDEEARSLNIERTAGVWKFVGVSPAEALLCDGNYHASLEPTGQI
ncbi:hypothetical protein M434DRAFT_12016 [Hypoxylon sp. CO27-5]|nr:hypothetical protein M434DRAFT_12016 [Hypoxylon sp. CO27-5]